MAAAEFEVKATLEILTLLFLISSGAPTSTSAPLTPRSFVEPSFNTVKIFEPLVSKSTTFPWTSFGIRSSLEFIVEPQTYILFFSVKTTEYWTPPPSFFMPSSFIWLSCIGGSFVCWKESLPQP